MKTEVMQFLDGIDVNEPTVAGSLQIFGLYWGGGADLLYLTLDEALDADVLKITETDESGNVPTLKVNNTSAQMIFLMAGEQLIGAKQNRVLNASIMVAAQSELVIPVSCVESGRWSYQSRSFHSKGTSSHSFLRHKISRHVYDSYREGKMAFSKQGEVWDEVSRKLYKMKSVSGSQALDQVYKDHDKRMKEAVSNLRAPELCCGVVFAFGGRIAGMDLFDKPATLSKLLPKVAKAYIIDALEEPNETNQVQRPAVENWLRSVAAARFEPFDSTGLGRDIRIEADNMIGAALMLDNGPVHVELFPQGHAGSESDLAHQAKKPSKRPARQQVSPEQDSASDKPERRSEDLFEAQAARKIILLPASDETLNIANDVASELQNADTQSIITLSVSRKLMNIPELSAEPGQAGILSRQNESRLVRLAQKRVPTQGLRMLITSDGLEDFWFVHWHGNQKTAVTSLYQWNEISNLPAQALLGSTVILQGLRLLTPRYEPKRLFHDDMRGCLFDFCRNKAEIDFKLRTGDICPQCRGILTQIGIQVEPVLKMLDAVRRIALGT